MTRSIPFTALILLGGSSLASAQAPSPASAGPSANAFMSTPQVEQFAPGFYRISAGSNATLAIGKAGAILVDTLFANPGKLAEAVKATTPLPVKYVINTHAHGDHTGNNADFGSTGAVIVSTPKAAERISQPSVNGRGEAVPPIDKAGWPTKTYAMQTKVSIPGMSALFIPEPTAHSDSDAVVFFPAANVLVMGDLHHSNEYPVWDATSGCKCGSYDGNLTVYKSVLKLANAQTKIVPGHGGVTNKAEVERYIVMLETVRDQVKAMIAEGKTKEEVVAAKLLANDHSPQPGGPDNRDSFIGTLYTALKTGRGA